MRTLAVLALLLAASLVAVLPDVAGQEPKQPDAKKTQPKKVDPKEFIPDAATLAQIKEKTEELRKAIAVLKEKKLADDVLIEVGIYLKAAENIVRFEEWLHANSVKWAQQTLDQGLERAKLAEGGKAVWRDAPGKWVNRAYRSHIDGSIQPYAVLLPHDYGKDPKKKWRLDIVLHGRDGSLTEAKFLATHNGTAPKDQEFIQLEPYGRGNNAYRWAGERDVFDAQEAFGSDAVDPNRVVLRGFSMGGAGTWHIGLHHPGKFCVIGPGAGFTTTHGYIANLPKELPEHQEKCLHIYDAVDYAENAFNVPVVAYSGEKDAQKAAADNIENALKGFKEPYKFTHLVAPGLEHQMPKEWQDKSESEYRKYAEKGRTSSPGRVRVVTYTPRYGEYHWGWVHRMEQTYSKAVLDVKYDGKAFVVETTNIASFDLSLAPRVTGQSETITIDGQQVTCKPTVFQANFLKAEGKWGTNIPLHNYPQPKWGSRQGPIDDAFMSSFVVVGPTGEGFPAASMSRFAALWDRYFRGALPVANEANPAKPQNLILFGDPESNPLIAKVLPNLPITWTKEKLVVNGVEYDPKRHLPVLIYPNPFRPGVYVVINSGHTFKEADLKGTNALLYPRLGDWAVIKPTPTEKAPAAYEVVAAGLFDENWQFPKKQ